MSGVSAFGGAQPITPGGLVELGYGEITSNVTVSSTTEASGTTVIPAVTVVSDGSPLDIEFSSARARVAGHASGNYIVFNVVIDGTTQGRLGVVYSTGTTSLDVPVHLKYRTTLSAGSHTVAVSAFRFNANCTVDTNGTGVGYELPTFLRVSKIVQQNDGLKPVWTPPIVTQLPGNPSVGDTVIYAADATNGVYWNLYYDGIGSYPWKYVGGPSLKHWTSTTSSTTSSTFVSDPNFAGLTIPLAGDYEVTTTCTGNNSVAYGWFLFRPNGCGYDTSDYRAVRTSAGVAGAYETASHFDRVTLTTGTLGGALRQAAGGTVSLETRSIKATPVRVTA